MLDEREWKAVGVQLHSVLLSVENAGSSILPYEKSAHPLSQGSIYSRTGYRTFTLKSKAAEGVAVSDHHWEADANWNELSQRFLCTGYLCCSWDSIFYTCWYINGFQKRSAGFFNVSEGFAVCSHCVTLGCAYFARPKVVPIGFRLLFLAQNTAFPCVFYGADGFTYRTSENATNYLNEHKTVPSLHGCLKWQRTVCLGWWVSKAVLQRRATAGSGITPHQKITDWKTRPAGPSCSQAVRAIPSMLTSPLPSNPSALEAHGHWFFPTTWPRAAANLPSLDTDPCFQLIWLKPLHHRENCYLCCSEFWEATLSKHFPPNSTISCNLFFPA